MRRRLTLAPQGIYPLLSAFGFLGMALTAHAATCGASASGVAFGTYTVTSATPLNGSGTITVTCSTLISLGVNYTIALDAGQYGTFAQRRMKNGTSFLNYNLYTQTARTIVWGDGTASTQTRSDSLLLLIGTTNTSYTVYGLIPAMQDQAAGTFNDTITVTINY